MTINIHTGRINVFHAFAVPVIVIFLFSFSYKNDAKDFVTQKPINDTSPELATIGSRDSMDLFSEKKTFVKNMEEPLDSSKVSEKVDASYPGGSEGWRLYIMKEFRYPEKAQRQNIQGKVIIHFTVDERGRLSNIEALTGDPVLQAEAKRVIKNSGKWIPATQNGKAVASEMNQSVIFRLDNGNLSLSGKTQPGVADSVDVLFTEVEIESSFPGGPSAWMQFLNRTFRYPQEAQQREIQGTVVVQFIVDKEGKVSNIEAISGPTVGGLREEVVRVIRLSGKWEPAVQNGRKVKSYKRQPITFKLEAK